MLPSQKTYLSAWTRVPRIYVLEVRPAKKPTDEPIALLLVERAETYQRDNDKNIWKATISISYQAIWNKFNKSGGSGEFQGGYNKLEGAVSLTSNSLSAGTVFLDLPGLHNQKIGTYLMNQIVMWVQQWPTSTVNEITVIDREGRDRAKHFYERFGSRFDSNYPGTSLSMSASELRPTDCWKSNIQELSLTDYLGDLQRISSKARWELLRITDQRDCWRDQIKEAQEKPVRWAIRQIFLRYMDVIVVGAFISVILLAVWLKIAVL